MYATSGSSCLLVTCLLWLGLHRRGVEATFVVGSLPNLQHGIGGTFEILSTTRIRLNDFSYDGQGPGAFLYYYPPGVPVDADRRTSQGIKIPLPSPAGDNEGALALGRRYRSEDLTFDLPSGTDVCDIATFTIWCEDFSVFFTKIAISPRENFFASESPCTLIVPTTDPATATFNPGVSVSLPATASTVPAPGGHDNCIPLHSSLQLSWTVNREDEVISFMLCGCQGSNPDVPQYMAFGLSGSNSSTLMDGADVTVVWFQSSLVPRAQDYHLRRNNRVQCRGGVGVCPDTLDSRGTCADNVTVVSGYSFNRKQCVSFIRPFETGDRDCDIPIDPDNRQQYIVWGIGGMEETALKHFQRSGSDSSPIHFGREPLNQCVSSITCDLCDSFVGQRITTNQDYHFTARIGPSGNERGYMAITGQAGWGIAFYINNILAPELVVQRGKTYTFIIEGGNDPNEGASYHPFYITDSISGGRMRNTPQQREAETVYAGFDASDNAIGIGRLCELLEVEDSIRIREQCGSLNDYLASLNSTCRPGQPGRFMWTPDENTPDVVYYQCATHRNLGWKITVEDTVTNIPVRDSVPCMTALSLPLLSFLVLVEVFCMLPL